MTLYLASTLPDDEFIALTVMACATKEGETPAGLEWLWGEYESLRDEMPTIDHFRKVVESLRIRQLVGHHEGMWWATKRGMDVAEFAESTKLPEVRP